jgi:hypothetical protein
VLCFLIGTNLKHISLNYLDEWEPDQRPDYRVDGPRFEFGRGEKFFFSFPNACRAASMGNGGAFARYRVAGGSAQGLLHTAVYLHFSVCFHDVAVSHSTTSLSSETDRQTCRLILISRFTLEGMCRLFVLWRQNTQRNSNFPSSVTPAVSSTL